jgi:hypothetical protein
MNPLELIFTVCLLANGSVCKDNHVPVDERMTISACVMQAQPIMAQWIGDNPGWTIKRWRCDFYINRREDT